MNRDRMTAEEVAGGEERARLWKLMTRIHPTCGAYQKKTERVIPVVRLRPAA